MDDENIRQLTGTGVRDVVRVTAGAVKMVGVERDAVDVWVWDDARVQARTVSRQADQSSQ